MSVASIFEMRFSSSNQDEGYDLSLAIGRDMLATEGCTSYDVVRDLVEPGHIVIVTRWNTRSQGEAVLSSYPSDPKIARVTELLRHVPSGFLGDSCSKENGA